MCYEGDDYIEIYRRTKFTIETVRHIFDEINKVKSITKGTTVLEFGAGREAFVVNIYNQDVYHWPESHLLDLLNKERFDVIGVCVIGWYYQF